MAGIQQMRDAANKLPKFRTTAEQAVVDEGKNAGIQEIQNLDFGAQQEQKYPSS